MVEMLGMVVLLVAAALLLLRKVHVRSSLGSGGIASLGLRLVVFILGAADIWVERLLFARSFVAPDLAATVRGGLAWLVMFEAIYRFRNRLRSRTLPVFIAMIWFFSVPLYRGLFLLTTLIQQQRLPDYLQQFFSNPLNWMPDITNFPYNIYGVVFPTVFVLLSYTIIGRSFPDLRVPNGPGAAWSGCKGGDMNPSKSQTTRLLCASAFLVRGFAREVLDHLGSKDKAVAPELGIDLGLVARVCKFADARERRFELYFFGVLISALVCLSIDSTLAIAVLILGGATAFFRKRYFEEVTLIPGLRKENFSAFDPKAAFPAQLDEHAESGLPHEDQNLFIYTGFNPFLGAGINLGGWSFAVDLSKGSQDIGAATPRSFAMPELYDAIMQAIADAKLDDVQIRDCYFISGREIRDDRALLPDIYWRPVQHLDDGRAKEQIAGNDLRIRHYKWIRVHDWGQELVTSYFLRCSRRGSNMFVEINRFVLTPLAQEYRAIDALPQMRARRMVGLLSAAVIAGPLYALMSPLLVLHRLRKKLDDLFGSNEKQRHTNIEDNPQFDYGSRQALREKFSSNLFLHYFQKADGDFYLKVLERTVLSRIIGFLDEHEIDTSDLRERQNLILNSGIIVHGGDVKAESLAVGAGAQALKTTVTSKRKSAKEAAA